MKKGFYVINSFEPVKFKIDSLLPKIQVPLHENSFKKVLELFYLSWLICLKACACFAVKDLT